VDNLIKSKEKGYKMEYTISHIFIIIIPIIITLFYLLSKGILIISILASILFILFTLFVYNNLDRKETLNIIKSNGEIYFNLSDDLLFSVKLSDEESLSELIEYIISKEMITIKDTVDSINFINFRDDKLHKKLNRLVQN
jgi:hypothetical protein